MKSVLFLPSRDAPLHLWFVASWAIVDPWIRCTCHCTTQRRGVSAVRGIFFICIFLTPVTIITVITENAYNETLETVRNSFPQYVRELEGVADGAEVAFHKVNGHHTNTHPCTSNTFNGILMNWSWVWPWFCGGSLRSRTALEGKHLTNNLEIA